MTRCAIYFFVSLSRFLPVYVIHCSSRFLYFEAWSFVTTDLFCLISSFSFVSPLSRFPSSVSRVPTHRAIHSFTLAFCFFDSSESLDINSRMGSSSLLEVPRFRTCIENTRHTMNFRP